MVASEQPICSSNLALSLVCFWAGAPVPMPMSKSFAMYVRLHSDMAVCVPAAGKKCKTRHLPLVPLERIPRSWQHWELVEAVRAWLASLFDCFRYSEKSRGPQVPYAQTLLLRRQACSGGECTFLNVPGFRLTAAQRKATALAG